MTCKIFVRYQFTNAQNLEEYRACPSVSKIVEDGLLIDLASKNPSKRAHLLDLTDEAMIEGLEEEALYQPKFNQTTLQVLADASKARYYI